MNLKSLKVGDEIWIKSLKSGNPTSRVSTVTKVGRLWITTRDGLRYSIKDGSKDGYGYTSTADAFLSLGDLNEDLLVARLATRICRMVSHHTLSKLHSDDLLQIIDMLDDE